MKYTVFVGLILPAQLNFYPVASRSTYSTGMKTIPSGLLSKPTEGGIQPESEKNEHWGGPALPRLKSVIRNLKSVFCLLFFPLALSFGPWASVADASNVTLGWDSNPESDLEGYVVYRNVASPGPPYDYSNILPEDDLVDPLHPKVTLTGLSENQEYYIALTAYNTEGVESSFSNDVCVEVVNGIIEACSSSSSIGASTSSTGGGSSGGCFISTASHESSMFSKFIAQPVIRSHLLAIVFLLLILLSAVKLGFNKTRRK
jgi:hypothetical protein